MKKIALYFRIAVITALLMASCEVRYWDPAAELGEMAGYWAGSYIDDALDFAVNPRDSLRKYYSDVKWHVAITSNLNDTLSIDFKKDGRIEGDSVVISYRLLQIKDSVVVTADGYRYSDRLWAHMYTVDEGIINYEGTFRVEFYENGKTTPWAWSDVRYSRSERYDPYDSHQYVKETETGWY